MQQRAIGVVACVYRVARVNPKRHKKFIFPTSKFMASKEDKLCHRCNTARSVQIVHTRNTFSHLRSYNYDLCNDCTSKCVYCAALLFRGYEDRCEICGNPACERCCGVFFDAEGVDKRVCLLCTNAFVQTRLTEIATKK
jgi:hypothetical protein